MAASTIPIRSHLTNDSGTPSSPVGDGTTINEAKWQELQDGVDDVFAGNVSVGGLLTAEGFGVHNFTAGGSGGNVAVLRNTSAGTGNYAELELGNNSVSNIGQLTATSSTFTTSNEQIASALTLRGTGVGGVTLSAINAAGTLKFWSNNVSVGIWSSSLLESFAGLRVSNTNPSYFWNDTNGASNEKHWQMLADGTTFTFQVINDALTLGAPVFTVTRSGATATAMTITPAVTCSGGLTATDLNFENRFTLTEHYKVGLSQPGMALLNSAGDVVAFFDDRGGAHFRNVTRDLDELGWKRTTPQERMAA